MGLDYKKHIKKYVDESLIKYEDDILSEGMIANAKLLSNDKYEFDSAMALFGDRLKIEPNGSSRISKIIKLRGFRDKYIYKIFPWPVTLRGNRNDFKQSVEEFSKIITSLFSYQSNGITYNGLEQIKDNDTSIGKGLNNMINTVYTLMAMHSKYYTEVTSNDIFYRDMRVNINSDESLIDIELKAFNIVRALLVVSDNFTNTDYDKVIHNKKSPINSRKYNDAGDNVVLNDLLYAGKYGKASCQFAKIFNNYVGEGTFEELLTEYDYVISETSVGHKIDKEMIKDVLFKIYIYYGEKYIRMKNNNALNETSLNRYKERVKEVFTSVISEYDLDFSTDDIIHKLSCERDVESNVQDDSKFHKLSKVKETFEPHEQVPIDANLKARELKLKYNLGE